MPIDSPMMNTSDWSAIDSGEVRKKKAKVRWKREREVMIVAPEMSAILYVDAPYKKKSALFWRPC